MSNYSMGDYIKRRRTELKVKQIDLCQGICDRGTLSRIELNKQQPTKYVFDALMQRMGIVTEHYTSFLTAGEFNMEELKHELANAAFYGNFKEMAHYIEKIEASPEYNNVMVRHFIMSLKTLTNTTDQNLKENLKLLTSIIRATKPYYTEKRIAKLLLSVDEVKIINNIANIYSKLQKHESANKIYIQLIKNLESAYMDSEEKDKLLIMLFYNYSFLSNLYRLLIFFVQTQCSGVIVK